MRLSLAFTAFAGASLAGTALAFPRFGDSGTPDLEDLMARAKGAGVDFGAQFADIMKRAETDPTVEASLKAFAQRSAEIKAGGPIYPPQRSGRRITTLLNPGK